jgi:hypothetical protein
MKHKGSNFEFDNELCIELFKAFRKVYSTTCTSVFEKTVKSRSPRFWVTPSRATIVVREMLRGEVVQDMRGNKRDMYTEIFKRVKVEIEKGDERTLPDIVTEVVEQPAPEFYITPQNARNKIKKGRRLWRARNPLFAQSK